jgi:hypothetical protein
MSWSLLVREIGGSFTFTHTQTEGIQGGVTYQLKYRAANAHGNGPFSATTSIETATPPYQMSAVTIAGLDGMVVVSWSETSSNGGSEVLAYRIMF